MNHHETEIKRVLSIAEAARYAEVSRGTLESWLVRGLLPYENLPSAGGGKHRFRRIRKADLDEFLDKCYCDTGNPMKPAHKAVMGQDIPFLMPKSIGTRGHR